MPDFPVPTQCKRCGKFLPDRYWAESCWHCLGDLCFECWDEYGHCGHKEAVKLEKKLEKGRGVN